MRVALKMFVLAGALGLGIGAGVGATPAWAQGPGGPSASRIRRPDHRADFRVLPYPYYPPRWGYGPGYWGGGWGYPSKPPWWGHHGRGYDDRRYFDRGRNTNRGRGW